MLVIALLAHISTCIHNITINIWFDLVADEISRTQVYYTTMDIFGAAATGRAGKKFSRTPFRTTHTNCLKTHFQAVTLHNNNDNNNNNNTLILFSPVMELFRDNKTDN